MEIRFGRLSERKRIGLRQGFKEFSGREWGGLHV